jgi:hypothetical protein
MDAISSHVNRLILTDSAPSYGTTACGHEKSGMVAHAA